MDDNNIDHGADSAENAPTAGETPFADAAAQAGRAAASEAKAEMEKTYSGIKSGGILGIFGFDTLYYPMIARVFWIISLILMVLLGIVMIFASFAKGIGFGLAGLIFWPLVCGFYMVCIRVWFEFMVVLFKINDGIQEMNRKMR